MPPEPDDRRRAELFGEYLRTLRTGLELTLRDVESATKGEVSNAYLSQLENGKVISPSPHILHELADVYAADYTKLMERAGYISPSAQRKPGKHGRAATFAIENLTAEEEEELLKYLNFVRSQRK